MSSGRSFGKQEDINSVAIRDIQSSSPENKRCFDCGERGPTYVNVTIGSFVCTKCSGMLRGVNPPHRIKSISMSSFSEEDVNLLNSRGNLWCKKVWLGTYSGTSQDEQPYELRMKQLMIDKYEKKRYYVDPTTIKDLNSYSSIYIKQSKSVPTTTNTSSFNLIGSRISQKFNNHQGNNKLTNGASSTNTPLQKNGTNSRLSNQNGAHNARPASNNQPLLSNFNHPQSLNSGTAKPVIKDSDPFGALNSVKNESFSNTTKIESFANFETANFESPPTGYFPPSSSFPPSSNMNNPIVCLKNNNNNKTSLILNRDLNNNSQNYRCFNRSMIDTNPKKPSTDFHFTAKPVIEDFYVNLKNSINNSTSESSQTRPSLLPLLTHDSRAVERRKLIHLSLEEQNPWVPVNGRAEKISSPQQSPVTKSYHKKYIPLRRRMSSSTSPPCIPEVSQPFPSSPPHKPNFINNNPFLYFRYRSIHNCNLKSSSNPFSSISEDTDEAYNLGRNFFNDLITTCSPNSSKDSVVDCSVTNLPDPLRSVRNNNAALASSSSLSQQQPSTTAPLQPFSTNNNGCGSKVTTPSVSNVKSPVMNMSSCATQDRYAALKDLDDIFRSVNVSENGDLSGGNGSGGGSQVVFGNSSSMNGMSAVFGNSHNDNSAFGRNEKSFFDNADASSPVIKNTASSSSDAWKRLSSNSTDNQGWANFGNSNNSSTNPFSASSNFSQLNTSPWPTTGTSPVQSGTSFPKTSNNGALDPFSMNNSNFPSTSDVNDLFANAPKPSGGKGGVSSLNNDFFSSSFVDNSITNTPWDSPKPFTENMKPSFNPTNPFL